MVLKVRRWFACQQQTCGYFQQVFHLSFTFNGYMHTFTKMHSRACETLQAHASADWMLEHPRSRDPHILQRCTVMSGRIARVHHATVKSPVAGDVTRTVRMLAGAMTNMVMTAPDNFLGLAPTAPTNNMDPHVLTGIAIPIWWTSNVPPANVWGMLPNTVTCLPLQYAWSAT